MAFLVTVHLAYDNENGTSCNDREHVQGHFQPSKQVLTLLSLDKTGCIVIDLCLHPHSAKIDDKQQSSVCNSYLYHGVRRNLLDENGVHVSFCQMFIIHL